MGVVAIGFSTGGLIVALGRPFPDGMEYAERIAVILGSGSQPGSQADLAFKAAQGQGPKTDYSTPP